MENEPVQYPEILQDPGLPEPPPPLSRFYLFRLRIYSGVLTFAVCAGLLLFGVPSLRHRLTARVLQLREAARGYSGPPTVQAQVGQNTEPFPAQFERPIVVPPKPTMPLITFNQGVPQIVPQPARQAGQPPVLAQAKPKRTIRIPTTAPGEAEPETAAPTTQPLQEPGAADANLEPEFRQGEVEREAYNLVLQKYTTVSGMVTGNNPALQFKNWGAAKREEDTYWVRLIFQQASDHREVSYIWEVKVGAKQITPLSSAARSLPKS